MTGEAQNRCRITIDYLIGNNEKRLVGEQGTDVVEEGLLRLERVTALLAGIDEVEDGRPQMRQRRDGLQCRLKIPLNMHEQSTQKKPIENEIGVQELNRTPFFPASRWCCAPRGGGRGFPACR